MEISIQRYSASAYSDIAAAIKSALESAGIYDSVTVSTNTVTIADNSKTYCTISNDSTTNISIYTTVSGSAQATIETNGNSYCWISTCGESVMVSWQGGKMCSIVFTKTKAGKPMIIYSFYMSNAFHVKALAFDSLNSGGEFSSATYSNALFSTLAGFCASSASESISAAKACYRLVDRYSSIPDNVTGGISLVSHITIDGKDYITDGYLCVADV